MGIRSPCSHDWFGGVYQDDRNQIAAMAVEPETFFEVYSEYKLPHEQSRGGSLIAQAPLSAICSRSASVGRWATRFRCARISARSDGGTVWPLNIAGIYEATNGDNSEPLLSS